MACIAVNIVFALLLYRHWGHVGLATAATISAGTNCLTLMLLLHRDNMLLLNRSTLIFIVKLLLANAVMAIGLWQCNDYLTRTLSWAEFTQLTRIINLTMLLCVGVFCYAATLLLLRINPKSLISPDV